MISAPDPPPGRNSEMDEPWASRSSGGKCRFGVFEFDEYTLELCKGGRSVAVRPQPLKVLALLLARPGELVARDDLQRALWGGDRFVDFEQGVNHAIRELRAALGDDAESPRFIQTLPRRGYRFIAPVERTTTGPPPSRLPEPAKRPSAVQAIAPPAPATGSTGRRESRWMWVTAGSLATVVAGIAIAFLVRGSSEAALSTAAPMALSVRPFSAPADPVLGIGLANAISARLGGQQRVPVQSMTTGAAPGVRYLLDGEITVTATDVIVLARLQDVARGATVWSDRIRVRADQLFSVEDVITERVVAALQLRLAAADQDRLRRRYTSNTSAYSAYLRGRAALVKYTAEGTQSAIDAFAGALQRDPGYALARAGLAMAFADMYLRFARSGEVEQWGERAEAEARAALALDPDLAEAHLARAAVARKREFDWNATITAGRRALVLNPNLDQARFFVAAAYYHNGYMEEALIEMERGRSLHGADPIEPVRIAALVALFSGSFAPARAHLEEVSRLSSQAIGDTYLALTYYYSGSIERGRTMLESLANHHSASTSARAGAALAGVLAGGDPAAARAQIDRVLKGDYRDHHVAYSLGAAYAQLGDHDAAVRWLRIAADTGFPCVPWFERDPLLEPLRRRQEFPDLLAYVRTRRDASLSAARQ
jgi:DNA-binding winged helix-turn-helix (wHTH) protein/tetratricopeptide (TPR) repeat protein